MISGSKLIGCTEAYSVIIVWEGKMNEWMEEGGEEIPSFLLSLLLLLCFGDLLSSPMRCVVGRHRGEMERRSGGKVRRRGEGRENGVGERLGLDFFTCRFVSNFFCLLLLL